MYAERRKAFENRIKQIIDDNLAAYPSSRMSNHQLWDLSARILSALEDSFQMGRREPDVPRGTSEDEKD